jgi:C4-dicarboxylate-specific signal transduction histidine kinase
MGQLAASIAHEVNQPIGATVNYAHAALRWLARQPPDPEEVRQALDHIIKGGKRAGDVIERIRALIKKVPPRSDRLDINDAILEVIDLTRSEVLTNGVSLQTQLATMPLVQGDRITATGDAQLDCQRHRGDERRQRGEARVADQH